MINFNCYSISLLVICLVNFVSPQSTTVNQRGQLFPVIPPNQSQPRSQHQLQSPHQPNLPHARSPQVHLQRPLPNYAPRYVTTQPTPPQIITGHQKIIDLTSGKQVYHHSYYSDGNQNRELKSWVNTRGKHEPLVARALSKSYVSPIMNQLSPRHVSYPPNTNGFYHTNNQGQFNPRNVYHQQDRSSRRLDKSNELSNPIVLKQSSPTNHPSITWLDNIESLVTYIKSTAFLNQVGSLGSPMLFKSHIVGDDIKTDEKIIRSNIEKTGLNFTLNDDCKPKLTTIKFGTINEPEIIYNPSSVEVLRCPQACFSWQFDCIPTKRVPSNFTVAIYTTSGDQITRKSELFEIESHVSCACSCQSLAGCFGNTKFSGQRLPNSR